MGVIVAIDQWAWIAWIVLIVVFLVIEMTTLEFTFLMLAIGGAVGLVTDLLGVPLWMQVIIAAITACLLLFLLRPPLLRRLRHGGDPTKSNIDALLEQHGVALLDITAHGGQVKLSNGDTWTARIAPESYPIPQGSPVSVVAIDGATAIVRPSHS